MFWRRRRKVVIKIRLSFIRVSLLFLLKSNTIKITIWGESRMATNGKWVINIKADSIWNSDVEFDTREEAIAYGKENFEELYKEEYGENYDPQDSIKEFYIGQVEEYKPRVFAHHVIEQVSDDAYEDVGEVAEDYLSLVKPEELESLEAQLNTVFNQWLTETDKHPKFWRVANMEEVVDF